MEAVQERGQKTRIKMIQAAMDLFHAQGVNATSVDQVLDQSGTGKSQFYYYFKSKEGLVHAVLQNFYERLKSDQLPVSHKLETLEDLERWFRFFVEAQKSMKCLRSCPVGTIANELDSQDELIRQDIILIFEFTTNALATLFERLKATGALAETVEPQQLAEFCLSVVQGGMLLAKAKRDIAPFESAVSQALTHIRSLCK